MKKFQAELVSGLKFVAMGKCESVLSGSVVLAELFVASTILRGECDSAIDFS